MKDEILEVLEEDAVDTQDEPIDQMLDAASTPPSTPSTITVPDTAIVNVSYTIGWTASTNDTGGVITYYLERQRQQDGGDWSSVGSTTSRIFTAPFPVAGTFQHRVRAKNSADQYSGWRLSDLTNVTSPAHSPTTPGPITAPSLVPPDTKFRLSWGASTDPQGRTITYELQSRREGYSWTSSGTTASTYRDTSISLSWGAHWYRVRALNSDGLYSNRTPATRVIPYANRPPTTPATISIDSKVYFNTSFSVRWGASSDPDQHTIVYYLERSIDGTAWTPVSSGSTTHQFTDTLGIAYSRVAYRVRARDQFGAYSSEWRTSPDRHISNRHPEPIASIAVPAAIRGGHPFDISWSQSVDPDGHAVTYTLERAINESSTYSVVYSDIARREVRDTITEETSVSVRYKVQGTDTLGAKSQAKLSPWIPVTHDMPPTISGYDRNIGTMAQGFTYDYTATDPAGHDVALVEYINDTPIRDLTVRSGTQQTFNVLGNIFSLLPNGRNTIKIAAASTIGLIANRVITFTKEPDRISATYTEPEKCRTRPKRINILPRGNFPAGAIYKAYATNNGHDEAPLWEDCTQAVNSRVAHVFQNKRKRSNYWGVNFRLEIFRDHAIEKDICTLNGISIQWE